MWTRRQIVCEGALTLFSCGFICGCKAYAKPKNLNLGCTLSDSRAEEIFGRATDDTFFVTGNEPIIPKSGNKDFDIALAHTLAKMSEILQALPGFAYYDDYDGRNAYATPKIRMGRADGTVLFGQTLLKRLMSSSDHPELGVAAVCAHEFGHILQYKRKLIDIVGSRQKTVKRVEL